MGLIAEQVGGDGNKFPLFTHGIGTKYPILGFGEASYCGLIVSKCFICSNLNGWWKSFTPRGKILRTLTTGSRALLGLRQFGSHLLCAFYREPANRAKTRVVATVLHQEARTDVPSGSR